MPARGVLYIKWGDKFEDLLNRSIESVKKVHPELPIHVETLPETSTLLDKSKMARITPFEETLFLDADTVVLDDLTYGFEKAQTFGLALAICECPWARRYTGLKSSGDLIEYNTGVIFFTRAATNLFDRWQSLAASLDSSVLHMQDGKLCRMPENDQAGLASAVDETGFCPFVLPMNWNLRPGWHHSFFGTIKIWHSPNPIIPSLLEWNAQQSKPGALVQFATINYT